MLRLLLRLIESNHRVAEALATYRLPANDSICVIEGDCSSSLRSLGTSDFRDSQFVLYVLYNF